MASIVPGCAWPEPGHAHVAEFCENGVKAVAEEATTERVTAAFFAEHSIAELRQQSEHWLGQQGRLTEPMVKRPGPRTTTDLVGRGVRPDRLRAALPAIARRRGVLHVRSHEQRGRVPLPAARPELRDQQPARLFEHVSRSERDGAHRDDRHRQGVGAHHRLRGRRPDRRGRPESRARIIRGC